MIDLRLLHRLSAEYGVNIAENRLDYYNFVAQQLVEKNKLYNLTAINDPQEILDKHIIDSLTLVPVLRGITDRGKVLDVGTGAGFPGMIAALAAEELQFSLLDSSEKKTGYLAELIDNLEDAFINTPEVICGRAEELSRKEEYREQFDICTSRAVASLNCLIELCVPFIKTGGHFVSMKGKNADTELDEASNAVKLLSLELAEKHSIILPDGSERYILDFVKTADTDEKYPRRAAAIKKRPL